MENKLLVTLTTAIAVLTGGSNFSKAATVNVTAQNTVLGQGLLFSQADTTPLDPSDDMVVSTFNQSLLSGFDVTIDLGHGEMSLLAYCANFDGTPPDVISDPSLTWMSHDSLTDIPDDINGDPIIRNEDNLDLANKIFNIDFFSMDDGSGNGTNYEEVDIQLAIWKLLDNRSSEFLADLNSSQFIQVGYSLEDIADADEIIQFAIDNGGEGFVPGAGEFVGVILESSDPTLQPLFTAFRTQGVPEPSYLIPSALLIASLFLRRARKQCPEIPANI